MSLKAAVESPQFPGWLAYLSFLFAFGLFSPLAGNELAPPEVSHPRGIYTEPFDLSVTAGDPETRALLYTLDGSDPREGGGEPITGPLRIDDISILRVAAMGEGTLSSLVITHTYLFPEKVLLQPEVPEGFPSRWGGLRGQPEIDALYKMNRDVIRDPSYRDMVKKALTELPTLSVVMDVGDLFGRDQGIYSNPNQTGREWERAASLEFFAADGTVGFQIDSGMRIQGGSSTENWKVLKLSMRPRFRSDYGASRLEYPFFPDSPVQRFNTLVFGAGHNLTWQHPAHDQRRLGQYVRDVFVPDLHREMGALSPHDRFVHLYLNGLYWGIYYIQDRPDASFMAENLGGGRSDFDVIRHSGTNIVDGDNQAWNTMMGIARGGLQEPSAYETIKEYLDVKNFADYMITNFYAGNTDWPRHNWYAGRKREDGAQFLFFSWDAEHVLKDVNENRIGVNHSNSPGELFQRLRENAEFRLLFADRVRRHFSPGGALYVDAENPEWDPDQPQKNRPAALYMKRIGEIDRSMALETARWGDTRRPGQPYSRNNEWKAELERLLNDYFPRRSAIVLDQFRAAGLYPEIEAPVFNHYGGNVALGFLLEMDASAGRVYYTVDGTDPRMSETEESAPKALEYEAPFPLTGDIHVQARSLHEGRWSALTTALFKVDSALLPEAHLLSDGAFSFSGWDPNEPAGAYPEAMVFLQAEAKDPGLAVEPDSVWKLAYDLDNRGRVNGLGENGVAFINTAHPREGGGYVAGAVVALNTQGKKNIQVSWTGGTVDPNERIYAIRLQYRIGKDGNFEDVRDAEGNLVKYLRSEEAGHMQVMGPVSLPEDIEDQPYVQLRWKYYYIGTVTSGPRAQLRIDDITVFSGDDAITYTDWRRANFSPEEEADETISGRDADPSGEGISNLARYAFGIEPGSSILSGLPKIAFEEGRLAISFFRDSRRVDIGYVVEASTNLLDWNKVLYDSRSDSRLNNQGDRMNIIDSMKDNELIPARRFLRVRVLHLDGEPD